MLLFRPNPKVPTSYTFVLFVNTVKQYRYNLLAWVKMKLGELV